MVNILLDGYMIDAPWLFDALKNYIKPSHKVVVVAFSFRDSRIGDLNDWERHYGKNDGKFYGGIVGSLKSYGIQENNIVFLNYFLDTKESAREKVQSADVLYFLGGLPDRMYERLKEFDLIDTLAAYDGVVIGYSAGAVIQLAEYYLTPDDDYHVFGYYKGLPYVSDFYIEVHYQNADIQNASIKRVLCERQKPVYAISEAGVVIVENGVIKPLGDVRVFA